MEIVKFEDEKNKKYLDLLLKKEEIINDGISYEIKYKLLFGDEKLELFKEEIECVKYKKIIKYLQNLINHEEKLDIEILNANLTNQMKFYREELNKMMKDLQNAKDSKLVNEYEIMESKKIYKKLVKLLHPDINPNTEKNENLQILWNEISISYNKYDYKRLQELQVLTNNVLKDNIDMDFVIENIDEKIANIEKEISILMSKEPYIYKDIIDKEEKINSHHEKIKLDLKKVKEYKENLKNIIDELKKKVI